LLYIWIGLALKVCLEKGFEIVIHPLHPTERFVLLLQAGFCPILHQFNLQAPGLLQDSIT